MIDEDKQYKMKQTEELRRKILVVDDDEMNFRVIGNICKEEPLYQDLWCREWKRSCGIPEITEGGSYSA